MAKKKPVAMKKTVVKKTVAKNKGTAAKGGIRRVRKTAIPKSQGTIMAMLEMLAEVMALQINTVIAEKFPEVRDAKYNCYSIVLKFGRHFTPTPKPKDIPWGQQKDCYMNALRAMCDDGEGLVYCEGFAIPAYFPGNPVAHAWCVDPKTGTVIDNTWRESGLEYYGIPFSSKFVHSTIGERGRTSILEGNGALMKNGLPKGAVVSI